MDSVRNEDVRRRAGIERELASRADRRVLRWFRHVERMNEYRMARTVLSYEVGGGRLRGRPRAQLVPSMYELRVHWRCILSANVGEWC